MKFLREVDEKITQEEIIELFGDEAPMDVFYYLSDGHNLSLIDTRKKINEIAREDAAAIYVADQNKRVNRAIDLAVRYGGIDGSHHKDWVIDQIVRVLAGDEYERIIKEACDGEDGPETYGWEVGIAP